MGVVGEGWEHDGIKHLREGWHLQEWESWTLPTLPSPGHSHQPAQRAQTAPAGRCCQQEDLDAWPASGKKKKRNGLILHKTQHAQRTQRHEGFWNNGLEVYSKCGSGSKIVLSGDHFDSGLAINTFAFLSVRVNGGMSALKYKSAGI